MKLYRFRVEIFCADDDDWDEAGSVLLPDFAPVGHVEHALASLGIYAPRGEDFLFWCETSNTPSAIIYDGADNPIVRWRSDQP